MEQSVHYILDNCHKDEMIAFMTTHPGKIEELIKLALANEQPYSWRAAWLLWSCMEDNDTRVQPHIPAIIKLIPTAIDGQKRDLVNVLRRMQLSEEQEGSVFDLCVKVWCALDKIPSVRYNALRLLIQIAERHPGLQREVVLLTQDQYTDSLSSGIKRSIQRMIKSIG